MVLPPPRRGDYQKQRPERFAELGYGTLAFEAEMRAAGVDWRVNLYGGAQHSFTHPRTELAAIPGLAYHRPTDERSWRTMLDLFDETFS